MIGKLSESGNGCHAKGFAQQRGHRDYKSGSWSRMLDKVMFWKDSHDKKMSETDREGDNSKVYPKSKGGDGNFRYKDVATEKYREYINTPLEKRDDNVEMKRANEASIDKLTGGKDEVDGKNAWLGDGKRNHFRKMEGTTN